jgi:hypothetical protein
MLFSKEDFTTKFLEVVWAQSAVLLRKRQLRGWSVVTQALFNVWGKNDFKGQELLRHLREYSSPITYTCEQYHANECWREVTNVDSSFAIIHDHQTPQHKQNRRISSLRHLSTFYYYNNSQDLLPATPSPKPTPVHAPKDPHLVIVPSNMHALEKAPNAHEILQHQPYQQ